MFRVWGMVPPPQDTEHSPAASHSCVISQWMGQATTWQACEPLIAGQMRPLCCEAVVTVRVRCVIPSPHDVLHSPHSAQSDTTQSIGHGAGLQP